MKMKAIILSACLVALGALSIQITTDHYRYDFYKWAIEFEASNAQLAAKTIELNKHSFSYLESPRTEGQETIIMLHGFGASKENWLRFSAPLSEKYHLIALDLMGHGENTRDLEQSYSIASQVEYVREIAEKLKLNKIHLIGNSMGGAISSLYAATYPEQVQSVVLISPAGIHDIPSRMDELLAEGINPLIANTVDDFENLLSFVMEDTPYIPAAITKVEAEKAASRVEINQKIFKDLRHDLEGGFEHKLAKIKSPVLIIWGDHDRAINFENIDKYAALIPNAQKLVLTDIGHLAMIEAPNVAATATLEFMPKG